MSDDEKLVKKENRLFSYFKKFKILNNNKTKIAAAILLSLIAVVIFIGNFKDKSSVANQSTTDNISSYEKYVDNLEFRLKKVISTVKGVNNVSVIVHVENSEKLVLAEDIDESVIENPDGTRTTKRINTTVLIKDGTGNNAYCIMEIYPEIVGVLIVADGASNEKTRFAILNAVTVLLDIENTKVEVLAGN